MRWDEEDFGLFECVVRNGWYNQSVSTLPTNQHPSSTRPSHIINISTLESEIFYDSVRFSEIPKAHPARLDRFKNSRPRCAWSDLRRCIRSNRFDRGRSDNDRLGGHWTGWDDRRINKFGIIGIIANTVSKYGLEKVVTAVVRELYKKGETRQSILTKIESYPITNTLRLKLKEELTTLDATPGQNLTPRTDR